MYGNVYNTTMNGPETVKTVHAAGFAQTGATGVEIINSCGITVVSTVSLASVCADLVLVQNLGVADGVASLLSLRSTGGQVLSAISSSLVSPLPVKAAWLDMWMATTSDPAAVYAQVRNPGTGAVTATWKQDGSMTMPGLAMTVAAKTLTLKQGANGAVGPFICTSGGSITVSNTNVAISDGIGISLNTVGGSISAPPFITAITASTSFVAKCATSDTSTYNYWIIKNAA
jgi:hypothetical protein